MLIRGGFHSALCAVTLVGIDTVIEFGYNHSRSLASSAAPQRPLLDVMSVGDEVTSLKNSLDLVRAVRALRGLTGPIRQNRNFP